MRRNLSGTNRDAGKETEHLELAGLPLSLPSLRAPAAPKPARLSLGSSAWLSEAPRYINSSVCSFECGLCARLWGTEKQLTGFIHA